MPPELDPATDLDLLSPELVADPYPWYARLRASAPVLWNSRYRGWLAARAADVTEALKDPRFSVVRMGGGNEANEARDPAMALVADTLSRWLTFMDPPEHTALRTALSPPFGVRRVSRLTGAVEAAAAELTEAMVARPEFDLVEELAAPLPSVVLAALLGVPDEARQRFKARSAELTPLVHGSIADRDRYRRAAAALGELLDELAGLVAARRAEPRDDLLSAFAAHPDLDDRQILATCAELIFGGVETTATLITNLVICLLEHPEQLERLTADPARCAAAVEEVLRFEGPIKGTTRIAAEPVTLGGQELERGAKVFLLLGSANRDPDAFADPDRFDVLRNPSAHLAFGQGRHHCLGAQLARIEGAAALGALLPHLPRLSLADPPVRWRRSMANRGADSLPLRVRR
ncbi:MAG: cytochrome P450 [Acidimicrobiales bacterium]